MNSSAFCWWVLYAFEWLLHCYLRCTFIVQSNNATWTENVWTEVGNMLRINSQKQTQVYFNVNMNTCSYLCKLFKVSEPEFTYWNVYRNMIRMFDFSSTYMYAKSLVNVGLLGGNLFTNCLLFKQQYHCLWSV